MRVAATSRSESTGGTRLAVGCHAVDHASRPPLPVVCVGLSSIGSSVDYDAVVTVAVSNIDAAGCVGYRIGQRIQRDVGRFIQQRVAGVEVVRLAARTERV